MYPLDMKPFSTSIHPTLLVLLILAGSPEGAFCDGFGTPGGTYAFESLRRPATASGAVFGGFLGRESGPEAVRGNPAALASVREVTLAASHQAWQNDLQEQWTGAAFPVSRGGGAAEFSAFHAGALDAFTADGASAGTFQPMEILAGVGFGIALRPDMRAGVSAHGLYLGSPGERLTGASMGAGLEWDLAAVTLGLVVRNLGPGPRGEEGTYRLPAEVGLSAQTHFQRRASVGIGVGGDRAGRLQGIVASRVRLHGGVSLMGGMRYENDPSAQPVRGTAGLEFLLGVIEIGYALIAGDETGSGHIVSVRFARPARRPPAAGYAEPLPETGSASVRAPQSVPPGGPAGGNAPGFPAAIAPETYAVWGGIHRSPQSAAAEIRALRAQKVVGSEVIARDDGSYRVRVARNLPREEAIRLAQRVGATPEVE
jgi:hypothetical protein